MVLLYIILVILPLNLFAQPFDLTLANYYYFQGNYYQAINIYKDKLKINPLDKDLYLNLGCIYKELGRYYEAINYFKQYIKINKDTKVERLLAYTLYLYGESEEALKILKKLEVGKKETDWQFYLYLGLVYEDLGKLNLALKYYQLSLEKEENSLALFKLGKTYYELAKFPQAIEYLEKLIKLDASIRLGYYYLANSYLNKKDYVNAYRYLSQSLSFYPTQKDIKSAFDLAKKKLGEDYFLRERAVKEEKRKKVKLAYYKPLEVGGPKVRVGMIKDVREITLKCGGNFYIRSGDTKKLLEKERFYTFKLKDKKVYILDYQTKKKIEEFSLPLYIKSSNYPFYILAIKYGKEQFWQTDIDISLRGELNIIYNNEAMTLINILNMEEYLYGVLPAEIYPTAGLEALKAQAVAARTIAFKNLGRHQSEGFDFCSDTHCQVYRGLTQEQAITNLAVDMTKGEVMFYKDTPIEAYYSSNCGGCLRSDMFGGQKYLYNKKDSIKDNQPILTPWEVELYFKEGEDSFCSHTYRKANFRWQRIYQSDDFNRTFHFPIDELKNITILKKGDCQHIDRLELRNKENSKIIEGDLEIRRYLGNLRSSAFKIEVKYKKIDNKRVPHSILLWGAGFGHGVGMCQEGTEIMAGQGFKYKEILRHYYKDIEIRKLY
ncbi:MAG: SpoIID/LytB domain-containing protein [Candidatus Omnitrophica bacterium]|nr:SpoIID/LytB domain-containing protein [Candidatus Omnitrophota bacterium]